MRESGAAVVAGLLGRRVGHLVVAAAGIAPNVAQVQPVAHFVGGGAAQVVGFHRRAAAAEGRVQNHNSVGSRRAARKLRVAQQATAQVAAPQVEVRGSGPGIVAAAAAVLHLVAAVEAKGRGAFVHNARGSLAARVLLSQHKLHARIADERGESGWHLAQVSVELMKVVIEHFNLRLHLLIGNVLGVCIMQHVHYHRNRHEGLQRGALRGIGRLFGRVRGGLLVDGLQAGGQAGVGGDLGGQHLHGGALAVRGHLLGLGRQAQSQKPAQDGVNVFLHKWL